MTSLAKHLSRHLIDEATFSCSCGWVSGPDDTWPDHVAATWAEHRTVTTIGQLVALPEGTVIRAGDLTLDLGADPDVPDAWAVPGPGRTVIDHQRVPLPALIVWQPEVDR